jgi:CBS-domain-containing membrane protein
MRTLEDTEGATAADLMHRRITTLPASATVGELRAYFAESTSHKLALLVEDERYIGSLVADALDGAPDSAPAGGFAERGDTVAPDVPAAEARERAMAMSSSRLPVVDAAGRLVGIIAINSRRDGFCGT